MTVRAAAANGNLTAAGTWGAIDATSYSNSESANTALTTAYVESTSFSPGAITIDGIAVKIASRNASPSGTMSIRLAQTAILIAGTEITVNISDLPTCTATSGTTTPVFTAEGGFFFVKFAAPVTLPAGAITLSAKTSNASQVNLWSTASANWSRYLRTTTTGAPAAGDDLIIVGEWTAAATMTARTVTMDSTAATDYGSNTTTQVTPALAIGKGGTLAFGTSASTNFILQLSGYAAVYNGGTLTQGASGTEIPRNSTATFQFDCVADGDFGLVARNGASVNMAGLSRTNGNNTVITKLAADASAGATSLTTVASTGWLNGDLVCYAPTSRTPTQFESKALTADAVGTTLTTAALTNARSGTSPTQAEVGLLTRNVVMKAVTANVVTFFFIGQTAIINLSFAQFRYLSTNASGKIGFNLNTTTGSFTMDRCSIHDSDSAWIFGVGGAFNNVSITNTVCYNFGVSNSGNNGGVAIPQTSGTWTIDNCMFCGSATTAFNCLQLADVGGTLTNCSISGNQSSGNTGGLAITDGGGAVGTFANLEIHTNGSIGIFLNAIFSGTFTSVNSWRNGSYGIYNNASNGTAVGPVRFITSNIFGNATAGWTSPTASTLVFYQIYDNCTFNGDTTFAQGAGFFPGTSSGLILFYSTAMSVVSGIKTKQGTDFDFTSGAGTLISYLADDSTFNGTNLFLGTAGLVVTGKPFLQAQNFGLVANDNRAYIANGTSTAGLIQTDTGTVFNAAVSPRSMKMSPSATAFKLQSAPIQIAVNSGQAATVSVQVQKNGSYGGNAPRLILKRQDSMGITADAVLATFSAGSGSWQTLTGTSPVSPQDGVFEFVVDCDGTAVGGAIFVDGETAIAA